MCGVNSAILSAFNARFPIMTSVEHASDEALLLDIARNKTAAAWNHLIERHYRQVYNRLAYFCNGDTDTAADLTQKVWEKVLNGAEHFSEKASFKAYLHTMVRNAYIDWLRVERSRHYIPFADEYDEESDGVVLPSEDLTPEHALLVSRNIDLVRQAVCRLKPLYREAIVLRYFEDHSLEEIAVITGEHYEAIKTRVRYGLKALRKELEVLGG